MNEVTLVGRNDVAFKNKKLQNATMQIFSIGNNIRQKWFEIGAIIALVDEQECFKDDGFSSVHEWVEKTFGLKKSRSYDLLRIGKEYTREVISKSGKVVGYECNLMPESSADNFTTTQVTRMFPIGHEMVTELVETGEINPSMTAKQIADVVKAHTSSNDEELQEDAKESNVKADEEHHEEVTHDEWLRMTFDKITTGELINELNKRGFKVLDNTGKEMTSSD